MMMIRAVLVIGVIPGFFTFGPREARLLDLLSVWVGFPCNPDPRAYHFNGNVLHGYDLVDDIGEPFCIFV